MDLDKLTRYGRARLAGHTQWELRSGATEHPYWGVVSPGVQDSSEPDARIADAVAVMTGNSVMTGWAAARLQGVVFLDGRDQFFREAPITIASPGTGQHRNQSGLCPTRRSFHRDETLEFGGIQLATIARAAYDMALDAPNLREAIVAIDMCVSTVMGQSRTTLDNIHGLIARHGKTTGIVQARMAASLASSRSASPWESRTRDVARRGAGMDGILVNAPVFDFDGNLAGIADLLDPASGHVIESDGAGHRQELAHADDNIREEHFERLGLFVSRVGAIDHRDECALRSRLSANQCRARMNATVGTWVLDKPDWWWRWPPGRRWD